MAPIDIAILLVVGIAFVAVVMRIRKKGTCGDCASAGSCSGACASCATAQHARGDAPRGAGCPACEGVDALASRLSRGIK